MDWVIYSSNIAPRYRTSGEEKLNLWAQGARAARGRIPKRGLGLGSAVRRIRELHGVGQEVLSERSGLSQGYLSQIESGAWTAITEDVLGRIAEPSASSRG